MNKKCINKKNLILSVVALILVMLLLVGVTYSWIEDITIVQIGYDDESEDMIPLTLSENIDGKYTVNSTNEYINLGPLWDTSSSRKALVSNGTSVKYDNKNVNGRKGYFYESGGVHLTPCYGDGQNFYFKDSNNDYTLGSHDNFNVDLISSTIQVNSPDAKTEFWFKNIDFKLKNSAGTEISNANKKVRVAIIADGSTKVFSIDGSDCHTEDGLESVSCSSFASYTLDNNANRNDARGENGNTLFTVSKGETKNVTIRVWLEAGNGISTAVKADLEMELISSWGAERTITIADQTTNDTGGQWATVGEPSAKMFLAIPSAKTDGEYKSAAQAAADTTGNTKQSYWALTFDSTTHMASVQIPAVYNDEEMYIYRCKNSWNGSISSDDAYNYDDHIHAWNWWHNTFPDSFETATFTMIAGSRDRPYQGVYGGDLTFEGFGTWDDVKEIDFYSHVDGPENNGQGVWYASIDNHGKVYIEDYSDYSATNNIYYYSCYCFHTGLAKWRGYIPVTSTKLSFKYKNDNTDGKWGYSWQTDATTHKNSESFDTGYSRGQNDDLFELTSNLVGRWTQKSSSSNGYYMWYNTNNSTNLNTAVSAGQMTELGNGTYYSSFTCTTANYDIVINNSSTKGSILNSTTTVTGFQTWAKNQGSNNNTVYWAIDYYWPSGTTIYVIFNPTANSVHFTTTNPAS